MLCKRQKGLDGAATKCRKLHAAFRDIDNADIALHLSSFQCCVFGFLKKKKNSIGCPE